MNVLMLVVYGIPPSDLFSNEAGLVNIRQLMAIGAYGVVEQPEQFSNPGDPKRLEVDTWDAFADLVNAACGYREVLIKRPSLRLARSWRPGGTLVTFTA